ncbi:MAG: NADPH-dependent glutamate synthase [Anaerolineae bacterium]
MDYTRGALEIDRKARLRIPRQPVPKQDPSLRIKNFEEVYLGYDPESAKVEASRCLQCLDPAPCQLACPLHNNIPEAMRLIAEGDFLGAANIYRQTSNLPEICGRVCPQEVLCQGSCAIGKRDKPVYLGKLESFVADFQRKAEGMSVPERGASTGKKVAVVGSGPAGIAVAEELARKGHGVTVYEAWPRPGGLLLYGIPSFKLSKEIVAAKIEALEKLGVEFVLNTRVGQNLTVDELLKGGFDAIFLGTGAGICAQINVPGEDLKGIYPSMDFLVRGNLPPEYLPPERRDRLVVGKRVAVIGGGDTAMDCVRTAVRWGGEQVTCVYRRTEAEMPGRQEERIHAHDEGVGFEYLVAPVKFMGNDEGWVQAMECIRMELGEPDASGRRRPVPIEGSEFTVEVDTVVLAIGFWPDPLLGETTPGLETKKWGLIIADEETGRTSKEGVFAAGDNVHGPDLVVTAMAAARKAAAAMDEYLQTKK